MRQVAATCKADTIAHISCVCCYTSTLPICWQKSCLTIDAPTRLQLSPENFQPPLAEPKLKLPWSHQADDNHAETSAQLSKLTPLVIIFQPCRFLNWNYRPIAHCGLTTFFLTHTHTSLESAPKLTMCNDLIASSIFGFSFMHILNAKFQK